MANRLGPARQAEPLGSPVERGQHPRAVGGDGDGVLPVSGLPAVRGDDRPLVVELSPYDLTRGRIVYRYK